MQSPNEVKNNTNRKLVLIADRSALLMLQPQAAVSKLQVRAKLADGRVLGPLSMNAPDKLPASDAGRAPYSTKKYSVLLPAEWLQIGSTLEVGQADFAAPTAIALTVTPGVSLTHYTVPMYLFGARGARSVVSDYALSSVSTGAYRIDQEYREKLPVAKLEQGFAGAVTMDLLPLPARNDSEFCYPAMTVASWADFQAIKGDTNARMLRVLNDMRGGMAGRDGAMAAGYYGFVQTIDGANQVAASTGGGLGGGGVGTSGGDYRPDKIYSAIFNHEMGHAYGLPHADAAAAAGDDPYPMGSKSGSSWSYDAMRNQLLSPLQIAGKSCDGRTVNNSCYQRTPMSGGDDDRDMTTYRWNTFSDYQAAIMQQGFLDKVVRDDSYDGGYKRWNRAAAKFEKLSGEERAKIGVDVLRPKQQILTVIGSVSHFNAAPTASRLFVTPAWTGNLPRQLDPTVQSDLDLTNSGNPGGWSGYYCLNGGCDYTLVATYGDGTVVRDLLQVGYHRFGYPVYTDSGVRDSAKNVLDGDNFATYAVNLPAGHGGLSKLQVFSTPFGSKWQDKLTAIRAADLGSNSYPLVNEWTPGTEFTGGNGAAGTTQFNAGVCQASATVKYPTR